MCKQVYDIVHIGVRDQLTGASSLLPVSGLQGLNTGCQARWQISWPAIFLSALFLWIWFFFPLEVIYLLSEQLHLFASLVYICWAEVFRVCLFCSHLGGLQTLYLRIRLRWYYRPSPPFSFRTPTGRKFWFLSEETNLLYLSHCRHKLTKWDQIIEFVL